MDAEKFGAFVQQRRKELGLSQAELGERLYVTAKAVSRWERGVGLPDVGSFEALALALEVSLVELIQGKQNAQETIGLQEAEQVIADTIELSQRGKPAKVLGAGALGLIGIACLFLLGLFFTDTAVLGYPVGSLVTGLAAWAIPLWQMTLARSDKTAVSGLLSLAAALTSVSVQFFSLAHEVDTGDFSAIEDTIHGLCVVVVLFCMVTVLLNLLMIWRAKKNRK